MHQRAMHQRAPFLNHCVSNGLKNVAQNPGPKPLMGLKFGKNVTVSVLLESATVT